MHSYSETGTSKCTGILSEFVPSMGEIISIKAEEKKCRDLATVMGSAAVPAQLQAFSKIK